MLYDGLNRKEKFTNLSLLSVFNFIYGYLQFDQAFLSDLELFTVVYLADLTLSYIVVSLQFVVMFRLRERYPHHHQSMQRAFRMISTYSIMTIIAIAAVSHLYELIGFYGFKVDRARLIWSCVVGFGFVIIYFVIYESFYIESQWGKDVQEKERLRQANLISQYESLKAQVNPHFLFNCLNSLSSLIAQDPVQAEAFVDEMSQVYRYLLRSNEGCLVSLQTEIQFIRSYFHLLKIRFGSAIDMRICLDDAHLETLIPPLTIQMLLENAVKHNELRKTAPLCVEIFSRPGHIVVRNNIQLKSQQYIISTRVGLSNISSKYQLIHKSDIMVANDGKYFEVSLPLIYDAAVEPYMMTKS